MRVALERYGTVGQPLWPVVPSSLYGALLAREETDTRFLVITFDASVHGWGAVLRTSPDQPGVEVVSCFCFAADLLGGSFIEPSALPDCPAVHAGFLATQAASQLFPLADSTVLIRSDCLGGTGCDLRPAEGVVSLTSASSSEHGVAAQPPLHGPRGHAASVPARAGRGVESGGRRRPLSGDGPGPAGVRIVAGLATRGDGRGDPLPGQSHLVGPVRHRRQHARAPLLRASSGAARGGRRCPCST